jgi:chromosome segregation ATPase
MTRRSVGMVAAVLLGGSIAAAQAPGSSNSGDIMPALLQEVRGLRAAIEQMTASASRVQLALGRLQLQEQRLNAANGRLAETRNSLDGVQRRVAEHQQQVTELEGMLSGQHEMPDAKIPADEMRRALTEQLRGSQRELAMANAEVQRLTIQESALASDVSAEQARWSDLNQRLEDLERSLRPLK